MIYTLFLFLLAAAGLSFLVFIHELGHYFMARRCGMRVEVFSIGFGKAIWSTEVKGVKWQIGLIPLGGYVKIAGMEKKGSIEPYEIADGYFGKNPWQRILVSIMGPLTNVIFALLAFTAIWAIGGRKIPFSAHTKIMGWIGKDSGMYKSGIRAGDELLSVNGRAYHGYQDFLFAAAAEKQNVNLSGECIDYWQGSKTPFTFTFDPKKDLAGNNFFVPAGFLKYKQSSELKMESWSSLAQSGIQPLDRLVAVDGELIFSKMQLVDVLNEPKTVLTVERNGGTFITRVPRLKTSDIHLSSLQKAEIDDWQHEAKLSRRLEELYFIPYALSIDMVVDSEVPYFNDQAEAISYKPEKRAFLDTPLQKGDKIVAVDGVAITSAPSFLTSLQTRKAQVIVRRDKKPGGKISADKADKVFTQVFNPETLKPLVESIGQNSAPKAYGEMILLLPVSLVKSSDVPYSPELKAKIDERWEEEKKSIEAVTDPKERLSLMKEFELSQNKLVLGGLFSDESVSYNPSPFTIFGSALSMMARTLHSLFVGNISPKHLAGPVAIVSMMQQGLSQSFVDGLYWLGFISLNLAVVNLLPIPVLDGGHVCFSLYEIITKKKLKAQTMEKLIVPFMILLGIFFLFVIYNDIVRIIKGMF